MSAILALPLAFAAGLLTILSPCVLPLAPVVVASARADDPRGPFALAAGLALTFALAGGALAAFGVEVGALTGLRAFAAAIMVAAGIVLVLPRAANALERSLARLGAASGRFGGWTAKKGLIGQAATGALLALAWAPCAGPTLGAAVALAAERGSLPGAMLAMLAYALGAAAALIALGFGLGRIGAGRTRAMLAGSKGRVALGLSLAVFGALVLTGLDHQIEAAMIEAMPDWLSSAATLL